MLLLILNTGFTQHEHRPQNKPFLKNQKTQKTRPTFIQEKEFKIFGGFSINKSTTGEDKLMEIFQPDFHAEYESGYWGFPGSPEYPYISNVPAFHFGAQYQLHNLMGFIFSIGVSNQFSIHGAPESNPSYSSEETFIVTFKTITMNLDYSIRTTNNRHQLSAGPTFNKQKVFNNYNDYSKTQYKLGFHTGYSLRIINRKRWFTSITADANLNPKIQLGPFTYESPTKSVTFDEKIGMTTFRLGINVGMRW